MAGNSGDRRHELGLESLHVPSWRASCGPGEVMGIRLVCEVLDHYHGPDARKLWLLSFAEKANDRTRTGWPTRDVLAHRTGRSASRVSHISDELVAEGVIKRDGGGNRSGPARFILLPIGTAVKGASRAHSFSDGKGGPESHPEDEVKGALRTHPKPEVKGAESARKGAESSRKGAGSKPQPAETSSLPLTIPSAVQPSEPTGDEEGERTAEPTAQTILAAFIDWVRDNGGNLTRRTIGTLASQVGDLLNQDVPDKYIRKALADWFLAGHHASTFDSYANAAMNAAARDRLAQNGHGPKKPARDYSRGGAGDPLDNEDYSKGAIL